LGLLVSKRLSGEEKLQTKFWGTYKEIGNLIKLRHNDGLQNSNSAKNNNNNKNNSNNVFFYDAKTTEKTCICV